MLADLAHRDVALAGVALPVELAVLDEERAVPEEAVVEQLGPALPAVGAAEQGALHFLVAVNGRDAEVVPLRAVEIENDGAEADDFRDRPRDQREDGRKVASARTSSVTPTSAPTPQRRAAGASRARTDASIAGCRRP